MRQLIQDIRSVVAAGAVDQLAIESLEKLVKSALPRLKSSGECAKQLAPGRYLCYRDEDLGFVVMILVWGKGDGTPIHDHGTWGVEAILSNCLQVTTYTACEKSPEPLQCTVISEGATMHNLPPEKDIHKVEHHSGELAMSLHIYGREMTGNRMFIPGEGYKVCKLECHDLRSEFDLYPFHSAL
jgi:predicted metal-dependent enzyme (double-stranded beta helix superfamily)